MQGLQNRTTEFNEKIAGENWQIDVKLKVPNEPIFAKGLELLNNNGDLLLAICLNNGYYNKQNIYRMLRFALAFSDRVQIFFTDGPAKHNYYALGDSENETVRKCRLHRNRLRNHCVSALEKINAGRSNKLSALFLDWVDIYSDPAYQESYSYLKSLYRDNFVFQTDINNATRKVLENRLQLKNDAEAKVPIAIEYVLEELAFILAYRDLSNTTKPIGDHGKDGFNYVYYEPWPVFENLVNGKYDGKTRNNIGFSMLKIEVG